MDSVTTFPSDGFAYLIGVCVADSVPITVLSETQVPDVQYPYPIQDSESFIEAVSRTDSSIDVYTDDQYEWAQTVDDYQHVTVEFLSQVPGRLLVTDSFIATDTESSLPAVEVPEETDEPVVVTRNEVDRHTFLQQEFGIS